MEGGMDFDLMELPDLADASSVAPSHMDYGSSHNEKDYLQFGQEAPPPFMAPPKTAQPGEDSSLTFMAAPRGMYGGTPLVHKNALPLLACICILAALVLFFSIAVSGAVLALVYDIEYDVNHLVFKIENVGF
eukprot:CAMPEP_0114635710 /NCGR_PEP_ID=MMETSP0168-20121206/16619_1 /TAXON_ID=95228 ORGANISM="Vannella sp., Strain DIVA3 517/6/12" /NCGR_SAMPLE_ID=MMETSP0168 /ASSEMBLY_ACC=CAM_ASM_000044 /LENGTH=131 /DNA_ID=CAMNT_0001847417 /DNA_START=70 /DNA_END=465 /DNA_ORIENTATION=-